MKDRLAMSLEHADKVFCYSANLGWDASAALAPLGDRATVENDLERLVGAIVAEAQPGDHVLVMSNGGFGGIHERLLTSLSTRAVPATGA
jgi:UDP-N-acetylmuramate: L-alanyl-gamma-D-glutamyl-meso-diaminopimelate ligase